MQYAVVDGAAYRKDEYFISFRQTLFINNLKYSSQFLLTETLCILGCKGC